MKTPSQDEGSRRRDVCLRRVDAERLVRSAHGAGLSIIRHSCTPSRCSRLCYLIALHQSTADNRVRVRLNGQQFLPAVHNHEAEVHFGLLLRRYGSRAPAVRADPVRTRDWFLSERRAILRTRYMSAYHSFSRRLDR